MHHPRRIFN